MSVMNELCLRAKLRLLLCFVILSAVFARRTYAVGRRSIATLLKCSIALEAQQRAEIRRAAFFTYL
jgi:hypothetical protein